MYLEECPDSRKDMGYVNLAIRFERRTKFQETVDHFGKNVMSPFVSHIEGYLTDLQIDMGDEEQTKISITNIDQSHSSIGVGNNLDTINAEKIAGTINEAPQKDIAEAAAEIQQLLEQLSQTNPITTTAEKLAVVTEATEKIEENSILKSKVVKALKAGGNEAFKEAIDHPLVNILLATIEGWKED